MQVGLAHAARHDLDQQFVRSRVRQVELLDAEGAEVLARHGGGDLHRF